MWELRWVLLVLGIVLIAALYLLGRGAFAVRWQRKAAVPQRPVRRVEPSTASLQRADQWPDEAAEPAPVQVRTPEDADSEATPAPSPARRERSAPPKTDRIITIRFVAKDGELGAEDVVIALRKAGLKHGRYGIFHHFVANEDEPYYSVANLTEPGSFELSNLADRTIPGMSFFMVLPGPGDPVDRFDLMVQTARSLAHDLEAELHDEKGSSWSIQRERYVREEIIRYRHQLEPS